MAEGAEVDFVGEIDLDLSCSFVFFFFFFLGGGVVRV